MEMLYPCCCCLLRPADKDLNAPYVYLGATEIFSDMLEECFQIHFTGLDYECGICEECVVRLRDASDFKLQVQRSQAKLQDRLERARSVKEQDCPFKMEPSQEVKHDTIEIDIMFEHTVKAETSEDAFSEGEFLSCGYPVEPGAAAAPSEPALGPRALRQQAAACSVRLERLGDDKLRHTSPGTSPRHSPLPAHSARPGQPTDTTEQQHLASGLGAGPEAYTCDTCGELFTRKTDIVTHLMKNSENKDCFKQIMDTNSLVNHNRTRTTPLKQNHNRSYTCYTCNKLFSKKFELYQHIRVHSKEIPCKFCSKKFSLESDLVEHQLIHTGDKPYVCGICDKKFSRNSHLKLHASVHTGNRPYSCEVCSKGFSQIGHLRRHKLIHTGDRPYICDVCNKKFPEKSDLTRHIRVHTGLKPYSCGVCFKKFAQTGTLMRHKLIHSGDKTYICELCGKKVRDSTALIVHMRVHTKLKPKRGTLDASGTAL